jgi:hypothetical protein
MVSVSTTAEIASTANINRKRLASDILQHIEEAVAASNDALAVRHLVKYRAVTGLNETHVSTG